MRLTILLLAADAPDDPVDAASKRQDRKSRASNRPRCAMYFMPSVSVSVSTSIAIISVG
jgi:hypothetical protein